MAVKTERQNAEKQNFQITVFNLPARFPSKQQYQSLNAPNRLIQYEQKIGIKKLSHLLSLSI